MAEPNRFALAPGLTGRLLLDEPMARHVSWRAGGRADRAYIPSSLEDLAAFLASLPPGEPVCFVGLGSNLLVRDGGYRGTMILTHDSHALIERRGDQVWAQVGAASPKVARYAANQGMEGAEFLAGVPGCIGGALLMNAGCYGSETWEYVSGARTIDRRGVLRERSREDFEVGYRHVALRDATLGTDEWFVEGTFRFPPGDGARARERIRELLQRRIATQPLGLPNAGSVFRNPEGDHAARLIESCGLKGRERGGARISEKHANFIVNPRGAATADDIESLIADAQRTVHEKCGVQLVTEVKIMGEKIKTQAGGAPAT